jgi:cell division septation protein DedD
MVSEDTEITLGVGRLVGLFFLLAAVCGVFLSIGYSLGKSTTREQALNEVSAQVLAASPPAGAASGQTDGKPSAAGTTKPDAAQNVQEQASGASAQNNLTFYKAVQQNGSGAAAPPANDGAPVAPAGTKPPAASTAQNAALPMAPAGPSGNSTISRSVPVTGAGTIVVQIAAVTREDDAVALAGALRKKEYDVIVVKNPAINDKFYHVQVGPFSTVKEAEAMKAKLVAEGYNPIVKK